MNYQDVNRLIRIVEYAEKVSLMILACSVRRCLEAYAERDLPEVKRRLEESVRFCEVAKSATVPARLFAVGAKPVLQRILEKSLDT